MAVAEAAVFVVAESRDLRWWFLAVSACSKEESCLCFLTLASGVLKRVFMEGWFEGENDDRG